MASKRVAVALLVGLAGCAGCTQVSRSAVAGAPVAAPAYVVPVATADEDLARALPRLARQLLAERADSGARGELLNRLQLELAAGELRAALETGRELAARDDAPSPGPSPTAFVYGLHAEALRRADERGEAFGAAYRRVFAEAFAALDDRAAHAIAWYLETPDFVYDRRLEGALAKVRGAETMGRDEALALVKAWLARAIHAAAAPYVTDLLAAEQRRRYDVDDGVRIATPDGATLSATVARPRAAAGPQPTALLFTIYSDEAANRQIALAAAARGYVGVVADARGKRLSTDEIVPYEHEVGDTHAVIDWISRQPWSNGDVGMYGGSYSGFAAWAAAKRRHPALKTIVTYAAALPGQGLPMTNNVFLNANYGWVFYVTNNRTLDDETYGDRARWEALSRNWYASGRPYREIDQVDGTPNPLLARWLDHPAYDAYWQAMVPYDGDYDDLDLPVLSITGYYDDGQISALEYLREHHAHRLDAEHYLVVGPYDHFGVGGFRKPSELRGYRVDPAAQFDTQALTFDWLDHVLRGAERPALLEDRINYEVMGADRWRHAPSLAAMADERLRFYLAAEPEGAFHRLRTEAPKAPAALTQVVDLADRTTERNDYYPDPIQGRDPAAPTGLAFVSAPFERPVEVSGRFSGRLTITLNKRDADLGVVLYELLPDRTLFQLSYYLGRASYAADATERRLLVPGEATDVPFGRTFLVSRRLEAGSRLMVVVDVNVNPWHQINYGTGKDVSDESIADAGEPLRVQWHNASYVEVPISREE